MKVLFEKLAVSWKKANIQLKKSLYISNWTGTNSRLSQTEPEGAVAYTWLLEGGEVSIAIPSDLWASKKYKYVPVHVTLGYQALTHSLSKVMEGVNAILFFLGFTVITDQILDLIYK